MNSRLLMLSLVSQSTKASIEGLKLAPICNGLCTFWMLVEKNHTDFLKTDCGLLIKSHKILSVNAFPPNFLCCFTGVRGLSKCFGSLHVRLLRTVYTTPAEYLVTKERDLHINAKKTTETYTFPEPRSIRWSFVSIYPAKKFTPTIVTDNYRIFALPYLYFDYQARNHRDISRAEQAQFLPSYLLTDIGLSKGQMQ